MLLLTMTAPSIDVVRRYVHVYVLISNFSTVTASARLLCRWESVMSNIHANDKMAAVAKPGNFNDPDMLQVRCNACHHQCFSWWCS